MADAASRMVMGPTSLRHFRRLVHSFVVTKLHIATNWFGFLCVHRITQGVGLGDDRVGMIEGALRVCND